MFAHKSAARIKELVYDGFGLRLAARRLNKGCFVWAGQADALLVGLNADLAMMGPDALRPFAVRLLVEMRSKQALIDKLTHENTTLKRLKFAASSEASSTGTRGASCR